VKTSGGFLRKCAEGLLAFARSRGGSLSLSLSRARHGRTLLTGERGKIYRAWGGSIKRSSTARARYRAPLRISDLGNGAVKSAHGWSRGSRTEGKKQEDPSIGTDDDRPGLSRRLGHGARARSPCRSSRPHLAPPPF